MLANSRVAATVATHARKLLPITEKLLRPTTPIFERTDDTAAEPPPVENAFIGPIREGRKARLWALVLQSQSIAFSLIYEEDSWHLRIAATDLESALESIKLYENENKNWPPRPARDSPRHASSPVMAIAFFAAIIFLVQVTGPSSGGSSWFFFGRADASRLWSEPWRMVTALTLHANGTHVLGNALSGTIFGAAATRRLGPGGALLGIVVAGALGNAANAIYHLPEGHYSIGASTAVFATVGILAAAQTALLVARRHLPRRQSLRWTDFLGPLLGGLTLLGTLGAGGDGRTDVSAHGFGFVAGLLVGGVATPFVLKRSAPSRLAQTLAALAAVGLIMGSWLLAMGR